MISFTFIPLKIDIDFKTPKDKKNYISNIRKLMLTIKPYNFIKSIKFKTMHRKYYHHQVLYIHLFSFHFVFLPYVLLDIVYCYFYYFYHFP